MRVESSFYDASELATAKDPEVCGASDAHFRRFNDCREFARSKRASSAFVPRSLAPYKNSAGVEFTLGTKLFLQQVLSVVTWFPKQKKIAARPIASLESEPNQALATVFNKQG
jgi:hypothetical protein